MVDRFSDHDRSRRLREKQSGRALHRLTSGLRAVEKLSDRNAGFVSSLVAVLRRNCPEVCVRRRLDLMGILALSRGLLSGSFPRSPSSDFSRGHKFPVRRARRGPIFGTFCANTSLVGVHSLGARHNSGQVSFPLQKFVEIAEWIDCRLVLVCCLPNVTPSACTLKVSRRRLLCLLNGQLQHLHFGPHELVEER